MKWPLLAATVAALAVTSLAEAGHGPADAVNALHLGQTNTIDASTSLTTSAPTTALVITTTGVDALEAFANPATGAGVGIYGATGTTGAGATGVFGFLGSNTPGNRSAGVRGVAQSTGANGAGVFGLHSSASGTSPGVLGETPSSTDFAIGVHGTATAANGSVVGAAGTAVASPNGIGLLGSGSVGVLGVGPLAGLFLGNVHVQGTLTKAAGGFKIDHPLDPAHKYLQHSFVESPEMKNVYDGVVKTNATGLASVRLPSYFQALNRDFRYQLTSLSGLQLVAVAKKIRGNRFTIQSEKPFSEVSWQVTGIRKDRYARAHPIRVELTKPPSEQGRYLRPELYGEPQALAVHEWPQLPGS